MGNLIILKILHQFDSKVAAVQCKKYKSLNLPSKFHAGFTLIEVLIAVLMTGILVAIATPGWFAFISQQRLNKANDALLSALQEAQRQAKNTKHVYSVSFIQDTNTGKVPLVSIYPDPAYPTIPTPATWTPLGGSISLQPGQVTLYTNISTPTTISQASSQQTVTFDSTGALLAPAVPVKIVVAAYQPGTQLGATINPNVKQQCVIVQTLIGGMQTAQNSGCN